MTFSKLSQALGRRVAPQGRAAEAGAPGRKVGLMLSPGRVADTRRLLTSRIAHRFRHSAAVHTLRRALGVAGTVLVGGALAWAPVAAFTGDMLMVTKAALAGVALLIVMKVLPRRDATPEHRQDSLDDER